MIQLHFSTEFGKINSFKEVLKKSSCLSLTEGLGKNKSLSNTDAEYFILFIQTVLYGGNVNEAYVETETSIYDKQKD